MPQVQRSLKISTQGKSLANITGQVQALVSESGISTGLCTLFVRHTSASLMIQENADPDVMRDMESFFADLVPEDRLYRHSTEGPDDMPAHIRAALTQTSEHIPIGNGRLSLGTWQSVYLWEHRARGSMREIVVHLAGE
jgi:secondary thiamine-phosphate synthase enzyme